jgi:hypothetical protein
MRPNLQEVEHVMNHTQAQFNHDGLLIHELEVHPSGGDAIGVTIDGASHVARNTWKRFGLLRKALQATLNRTRIAGWVIEVLLGHCTYFSLVMRDVLCVFMHVIVLSSGIIPRQLLCGMKYGMNCGHLKA